MYIYIKNLNCYQKTLCHDDDLDFFLDGHFDLAVLAELEVDAVKETDLDDHEVEEMKEHLNREFGRSDVE